jgi:SAM-dependent methyltransferase
MRARVEIGESRYCKSGLAALSDLKTSSHREIFCVLESQQTEFLHYEKSFRSPSYPWPSDVLRNWSRVWEYPYVYFHLQAWRSQFAGGGLPTIADVGSGLTFFPFSIARLGCHVVCTDPDPVCETDFHKAHKFVRPLIGSMEFRRTDGVALPFGSEECDAVFCISVLEHIENFEATVCEIARILKPGGIFLLTIDIDLSGQSEISVTRHAVLIRAISQVFDYLLPDTTVHPGDLLHSLNSPFPISKHYPYHLTVQGFCLVKRS